MVSAPRPANETARIEALHGLDILDTPAEERFDSLTRLARRIFGVPIALVSLLDVDRQWFKSTAGLDATETTRDDSFCTYAILEDDMLVIPDAHADPRFRENPFVTGDPHVRFYAGCPLEIPPGNKVGTLCLIDTQARVLTPDDRELLRDLGRLASQELMAVQLAHMDELTQLLNRRGFERLAKRGLTASRQLKQPACLLAFDLDGFKHINDTYGHAEGDRALKTFAGAVRDSLRDGDLVGRLGGDEFAALLMFTDASQAAQIEARVSELLEHRGKAAGLPYDIRFSMGSLPFDPASGDDLAALMDRADAAMYSRKQHSRRDGEAD